MNSRYRFVLVLSAMALLCCCTEAYAQFIRTSKAKSSQPLLGMRNSPLSSLLKTISLNVVNMPLEEVISTIAKRAGVRISYSNATLPARKLVSLSLAEATVAEALIATLQGTNVDFSVGAGGQVVLMPSSRVQEENGTIVGRVLEARTNKPLPGANVFVEGTSLGTLADAEGNFRIERVPPGKYKLRASVVGYGKISKDITVHAGNQTSMDFFLDETSVGLDEVVVTGVAFETRRREIPADIGVITAKQIEQKGITNLTDMLKGELPGVMAVDNGQNDYASRIYLRGSALSSGGTEYAKIYIDGIELSAADGKDIYSSGQQLLSTIDPSSIERIEVIRGPHAAALYGAAATAGVIQIITKKGSSNGLDRPQVNASVSVGYIQSHFLGANVSPSGVAPLQTNSNVDITGGKQSLSYRAGISYATAGEWIPGYYSKMLGLSAGLRVIEGPISAELTALWSNRKYSDGSQRYFYERWPGYYGRAIRDKFAVDPDWEFPNERRNLNQTTLGLNISYRPLENWAHMLIIGQDNNAYDWVIPMGFTSASDTQASKYTFSYTRRSLRYNTSYRQSISGLFSVRATLGAEYSFYNYTSGQATNVKLNKFGDISNAGGTSRYYTSQDRWTAGYTGVVELGYAEGLFATVSMGAKQDPRGFEKIQYIPPRYGLTYSHDVGAMQLRLRGQYGAGLKPLDPSWVSASTSLFSSTTYRFIDNYDLVAERRAGWDAGLEAYLGEDASLSLTRFDEQGKGIIQPVIVRGSFTAADPGIYQYQNTGDNVVKGWELSGKLNFAFIGLDALTLKANYTYSDNRIVKIYSSAARVPTSYQLSGDRVDYVPLHSGGGGLSMNLGKTNASLDWQFSAGVRSVDFVAWYDYIYGNAVHRDLGKTYAELGNQSYYVTVDGISGTIGRGSVYPRSYRTWAPAYIKFSLRAEHELYDGVRVFLNVRNLFNDSSVDNINYRMTQGRVTTLGVRVRY